MNQCDDMLFDLALNEKVI